MNGWIDVVQVSERIKTALTSSAGFKLFKFKHNSENNLYISG